MNETRLDRVKAFVTARRTGRLLRLTIVIFVIHVALHLGVFAWLSLRFSDLARSISAVRVVIFIVVIPASIYLAIWIASILVAVFWEGSERYWRGDG